MHHNFFTPTGLMFVMFAADEAVLVELHPSYRQDRHFRHAARMTGKIAYPCLEHRSTLARVPSCEGLIRYLTP